MKPKIMKKKPFNANQRNAISSFTHRIRISLCIRLYKTSENELNKDIPGKIDIW